MRPVAVPRTLKLLFLACFTVLIQGYHLGVDDGAIYIPAVKKIFNPGLYPFGSEFFLEHGRLSLFAPIVGGSARLLHLPVDCGILVWHVAGIFLLLLAGWQVASACFASAHARWSAVLLLAATLPVPVAGTALVIMDPYLTARSFSAPMTLFVIAFSLSARWKSAFACLLLAGFIHPQMAVYGVGFLCFFWLSGRMAKARQEELVLALPAAAVLPQRLPQGFSFNPVQGSYRDVLHTRTFFYAQDWAWWEWFGAFAPVAILLALAALPLSGTLPAFRRLCAAAASLGIFSIFIFLVLNSTERLESFVRLQPMRSFHLIYIVLFLLLGGVLGEYVLQRRAWRHVALFAPLAFGMFVLDRFTYIHSDHLEWHAGDTRNAWVSAFQWIRSNTPTNAVFALDPRYLAAPGEDQHGFRAIAERSVLADELKDSGAVSLFPQLAPEWEREQNAQEGWKQFQAADFERLAREYPVTWVVVEQPAPHGLNCLYSNSKVSVCRLDTASTILNASATRPQTLTPPRVPHS